MSLYDSLTANAQFLLDQHAPSRATLERAGSGYPPVQILLHPTGFRSAYSWRPVVLPRRNGRHRSGADSRQRKIIAISSGRGSVSKPFLERRAYFYDMSKSALKLGMRKLQRNVAGRRVLIGIFAPGIVDTDLNNGLRNGVPAIRKLITPEERLPAS